NVENDQLVGIQLRGQIYTGKVTGDQAVVSIPSAAWQGVTEGATLALAVNVNNKAGNSAATNTSTRFTVDRLGPSAGVYEGEFPVLEYQGKSVVVRMSEPLDESQLPPLTWFSLTQGGQALTIKSVSFFTDPRSKIYGAPAYGSIELTLDQTVDPYAALSLRYTDPNPAQNDTRALQDLAGNDALSFSINNQPSQIAASFSITRAGVKAVYTLPSNNSLDPIAAYDLFMPANGQRGIGYANAPLASANNVKSLLGVDKPADTPWRIAGLASSLSAGDLLDVRTQQKEIATLIYDRIEVPLVTLPFGLIAYSASSNMEIGSRVVLRDGSGTLKLVEPATYQISFKSTDPGVYVPGIGTIGTTGPDVLLGGASADIVLTFSGNDTVTAGAGADGIIAGSGSKTIIHNRGDSGLLTDVLASTPKTQLSTASFDVLSGLGLRVSTASTEANDQIDFPDGDYVYVAFNAASISSTFQLADRQYTLIRGSFDPIAETFSLETQGGSSLLTVNLSGRVEAIVLVGFVGSTSDDGFMGKVSLQPPVG
ncbi:MAG: hypothetical protein EB072_01545, partial [Betaproteobacteria bacterium]|nr:hypothetical protein [Betaproteobacteria bacterium]